MFKYKKSLLSIAAATALAVTSVSADYIPLTDTGSNEQAWTLFGVTGLQISGAGAGTSAGTFSITDSTANAVEDDTIDELFVEGLVASTGEDLAKVKAISPLSFIEVRVNTTDAVFNETEPVRTMYVTLTEGGGPSFAFSYRASLEGERMEYSRNTDGSNARSITISSEYTYNNPAYGEVIQEVAGIPGAGLVSLADIVDYDFSNNPLDSAYYDKDATPSHQDTATANQYLRVYTYDAATELWGLYDSRNAAEANDFDTLEKGKAYWAKMDDDAAATVGGLVLGSASISAADYATAGIADGWNLMAFDKANPDIRKSTTGLVITMEGTGLATDILRIYDASGNHYVDVASTSAASQALNDAAAKAINNAIKVAKVNGTFPDTFDLRAYPISATELALISSKRFIIAEAGATSAVANVKTLAQEDPYSLDVTDLTQTDDVSTGGIIDLGVLPVGMDLTKTTFLQAMSKYGEYAMVIEPIYLAEVAGAARLHLQSASASATTNAAFAIDNDITLTTVAIGGVAGTAGVDIGGTDAFAYTIDVDSTSLDDMVLVTSTEPFYVRDHTFTRIFEYNIDTTAGTTYIRGTGTDADIAVAAITADATAYAALVNGSGAVVSVVDPTNADQLVIITDVDDSNEFTITEATTADQIEDATSTSDLVKGAIKGVYSLSNLATVNLLNTTTSVGAEGLTTPLVGETLTVAVTTLNGTVATSTAVAYTTDSLVSLTTKAAFIKQEIESYLGSNGVSYESVAVTAADPHLITIVSSDVLSFVLTHANVADTAVNTVASNIFGAPDTLSADLASDLKFNAVYTPNYVVDGPLYTMKDSGFTLKAMVTGTTDLSDGTVNWDSIDLTRKPSEWLDSQDYNLFKVDEKAGYWAYLETDTGSNDLAISNAVITPLTYTYHFNEVGASGEGTNYNHVSGNIALTIDGLDEYDDRKSAVIKVALAGSEVELAKEAGSDVYNGKLSSYEIENMPAGYSYEVFANLADGLGYNQKALDTGLVVDYAKPDAPTVTLGDGTSVVLSSASADVAGYYIFDGQIPEVNTAQSTDLFKTLTAAEAAAGYGLCQDTTKLAWFTSAYKLNIIAVDVTGVLGQGNVSDTTEQKYVPMLKDAVRLENSRAGALVPTTEGEYYDALCADQGIPTENYGVTLTATVDLTTVTMSYTPKNITDTTATPISLFVSNGGAIAKITYADVYVGDSVYVEVGSQVFALVLPSLAEIEGADVAATPIGGNTPLYGAIGVGASTALPLPLVDGFADEDTTNADVPASTGYAEVQDGQNL